MRPILLQGHTRPLTRIKYNRDGDLLFTVSKDNKANVWYSHTGERLGSFNGHNGTIWDIDISYDSQRLLTGSADSTCRMWDVSTGKELFKWDTETAVRAVGWALGDAQMLFVTDATMGHQCQIYIYTIDKNLANQSQDPDKIMKVSGPKATVAAWGDLNKLIYTGHEDGSIQVWDPEIGERTRMIKMHAGAIQDLQFPSPWKDKSHFITASKDHSAQIFDAKTLKVLKKYQTERPVNSAALSPDRPHIVLGGGQEAMSVTTTSAKQGKFEVRFFHLAFEEEIGRVKGHFGPINTLAFSPDGRGFASGGEDGYVRLHFFDEDYYNFQYEEEKEQ
ncbi:hypothetical protein SeMB42_g02502 [Synchytrium endobioticum]|uniref:Eukaryotic translation initiation factor 3 subunit I n=1 Tax=Synchytrium endobioticum TaxID=286115 RepID=A0A507DEQ7_9FUNG|nr:hypothetical protein SeLEV6574_g02276 [Synchytrium endobioticum]TPX49707.1 hypothetical protein SeMB42_g02502 [Synchytrium endobioticum]